MTEDWYFWSHRLPMARAAQAAGFDVGVATRVDQHGERIRAEGFALYPLRWRRRNHGPWATIRSIAEVARLYRRERPLIVHHVALKAIAIGSVAALIANVPAVINSVTGMGFLANSTALKARLLRGPTLLAFTMLTKHPRFRTIVQNQDDLQLLRAFQRGPEDRIALIRGSGVDIEYFSPAPDPPAPPLVAAYVGRMLADKGLPTLIEAQQMLQRRGFDLRLVLAGAPDPENPTSIDAGTLARWQRLPGIQWLGVQEDIRGVWAGAHIAVLPSRREGLPKSLLEAAAMARAIVATDVPGCREIARAGLNALLVPPDDADALAAALERLARDCSLRCGFGIESRKLAQAGFSERAIGAEIIALYRSVLADLCLGSQIPSVEVD